MIVVTHGWRDLRYERLDLEVWCDNGYWKMREREGVESKAVEENFLGFGRVLKTR